MADNKKSFMKNIVNGGGIKKIILFALSMSLVFSLAAYLMQSNVGAKQGSCSYLDPLEIDIFAFLAGIFLIIESSVIIFKDKKALFKQSITRYLRMSIGFSITTIHITQVIHK